MGVVGSHLLSLGVGSDPAQSKAKKALRDYYKWHQKYGIDDATKIKEFFVIYDEDSKGYLNETQAFKYVSDLIDVSSHDLQLRKLMKQNLQLSSDQDKKEFYRDFVMAVLHSMDPLVTGQFSLANLQRPNQSEWTKLLSDVSAMGIVQRQFTRRLRDTRIGERSLSDPQSLEGATEFTVPGSLGKAEIKLETQRTRSRAKPKTSKARDKELAKELRDSGPLNGSAPALLLKESLESTTVNCKKERLERDRHESKSDRDMRALEEAFEGELEGAQREARIEQQMLSAASKTPAEIAALRELQVARVCELLEIDMSTAQTLLHHTQWNEDALLNQYFEDRKAILKRSGLSSKTTKKSKSKSSKGKEKDALSLATPIRYECSVCLDDVRAEDFTSLPSCSHAFCNNCWRSNLELQISEGNALFLHCMHAQCRELVPNALVMKLVSSEYSTKFKMFLGKSYVKANSLLTPCPAPDCENALTEFSVEGFIKVGECLCGYRFCWDCQKEAHPSLLQRWEQACASDPQTLKWLVTSGVDQETLKWMQENTKECPKCGTSVQKNAGCYAMVCSSCSAQWCWLCLGDWQTHPNHFKCSTYNKGKSGLATNKALNNDEDTFARRQRVGRVAEYFTQLLDHDGALKNLMKGSEREKIESKMNALKDELPSLDVRFGNDALNAMRKCREALKYSCIFAYMVESLSPNKNEVPLIEALQESVQMFVERLTFALNLPLDRIDPPMIRRLAKFALTSRDNLLEALLAISEELDIEASLRDLDNELEPSSLKKGRKKSSKKAPEPPRAQPPNPNDVINLDAGLPAADNNANNEMDDGNVFRLDNSQDLRPVMRRRIDFTQLYEPLDELLNAEVPQQTEGEANDAAGPRRSQEYILYNL